MTQKDRFFEAVRIGAALLIALAVIYFELRFGLENNSFALVADGLHVCADLATLCFSLMIAIALLTSVFAKKEDGEHYEQKLHRRGAILNARLLGVVASATILGGLIRFFLPYQVSGASTFGWALVGLAGNLLQHWLIAKRNKAEEECDPLHAAYRRSILLHIASDAYTSVAVIISGGIAAFTAWHWTDPVFTIGIGLYIAHTTRELFREIKTGESHHGHRHS